MRKTLKFGGKSLGSAEAMRNVANIMLNEQAQLTVLSSMYGTHKSLLAVIDDDLKQIPILEKKYRDCIEELLTDKKQEALDTLEECFNIIRTSKNPYKIMAQGEILTSKIFVLHLAEKGMNAEILYAPDFLHTNQKGETYVDNLMLRSDAYYITQGFICSNEKGEIWNLGRFGADYTASLLAKATESTEVQIWSVDKVLKTGDPDVVTAARPVDRMSFSQAAELAYFGARILHPQIILPCREANIDVVLKNTANPDFEGTRITAVENDIKFLAAAYKDNITLIRVISDRMLMSYGFLRDVLDVFKSHKTVVDMVTTSEVAVSITVSDTHAIKEILEELKPFGRLEVERSNSVVCLVGNMDYSNQGMAASLFEAINKVPVKMISYGASHRSISLLVDTSNVKTMLLNIDKLF